MVLVFPMPTPRKVSRIRYARPGFRLGLVCLLTLTPIGFAEERSQDSLSNWVFRPLERPSVPEMRNSDWARNPIDSFILSRLEENGIDPTPEADRRTLIRRASFDLSIDF
jgi:hypothetical protein